METKTNKKYNRPRKSEDDLNISREEQDRLFSYWGNKKDEALKRGASRPVKTWFMFRFIIGTGLRATEACNVQIKDLNLDTKTPNVVVRNGKGNRRRNGKRRSRHAPPVRESGGCLSRQPGCSPGFGGSSPS